MSHSVLRLPERHMSTRQMVQCSACSAHAVHAIRHQWSAPDLRRGSERDGALLGIAHTLCASEERAQWKRSIVAGKEEKLHAPSIAFRSYDRETWRGGGRGTFAQREQKANEPNANELGDLTIVET